MFKKFMRYADYKRDPYSIWNGRPNHGAIISSRGDTDDDLSLRNTHGGINTKAVRASEALTRMHMHLINSPSTDNMPPLNWSEYPLSGVAHDGLVEIWNFSWITMTNEGFDYCGQFDEGECVDTNFCGWCGYSKKCLPGDRHGPFFGETCRRKWVALGTADDTWLYYLIAALVALVVIGGVGVIYVVICKKAKTVDQMMTTGYSSVFSLQTSKVPY